MSAPFVYFDESGQTYYNYLDQSQLYFAYGGLNSTEDEANALKAKYFSRVQADELHYVQLRRREVGQSAIKSFLEGEKDWIKKNFKWFLIDKRYALLGKYVDLLIEPEFNKLGENLYSGAGAQKLLFMFQHFAILNGKEIELSKLMTSFSEFARKPSLDTLSVLETVASRTSIGVPELDMLFRMPFIESGTAILHTAQAKHLDLNFTAAFTVADHWYQAIREPFYLIHDESSTLSGQANEWRNMTREDVGYQTTPLGGHDAAINVPLKSTIFFSSVNCVPLQIVDVLLGVSRSTIEWQLAGRGENPFLSEVASLEAVTPPDWSILPLNKPFDSPADGQSIDEANESLSKFAKHMKGEVTNGKKSD